MKFNFFVLGVNLEKQKNGFSGEGDWICLKSFVENEKGYGEFYLNLNPKTGKGEIVMKDPQYTDFLKEELVK